MTFRARVVMLFLAPGSCVTFLPDAFDAATPVPPLPVPGPVPLALMAGGDTLDWDRIDKTVLTILTATRAEIRAAIPDGRHYRMTPRKPSERGGYWLPNRGMSEWVVREEMNAEAA